MRTATPSNYGAIVATEATPDGTLMEPPLSSNQLRLPLIINPGSESAEVIDFYHLSGSKLTRLQERFGANTNVGIPTDIKHLNIVICKDDIAPEEMVYGAVYIINNTPLPEYVDTSTYNRQCKIKSESGSIDTRTLQFDSEFITEKSIANNLWRQFRIRAVRDGDVEKAQLLLQHLLAHRSLRIAYINDDVFKFIDRSFTKKPIHPLSAILAHLMPYAV